MRLAYFIAVLAVAASPPAAIAEAAQAGNACSLLTGKQLASFGVAGRCKPLIVHQSGFMTSYATWGGSNQPHLALAVTSFSSTSSVLYQLKLREMKSLGKKVGGIGSSAYERFQSGSTLAIIDFVTGKRFVTINVNAKMQLASARPLESLARALAAKL
jgi:hypothetical protein